MYIIAHFRSEKLFALLHVCEAVSLRNIKRPLPKEGNASFYVNVLHEDGIHYPKFEEIFQSCLFQGHVNCDEFYPFLTEEGICFTFNSPNFTSIYREET